MYYKCYFCLDQLLKLKKESTASFFVNFGGAVVQKSQPTLLYLIQEGNPSGGRGVTPQKKQDHLIGTITFRPSAQRMSTASRFSFFLMRLITDISKKSTFFFSKDNLYLPVMFHLVSPLIKFPLK